MRDFLFSDRGTDEGRNGRSHGRRLGSRRKLIFQLAGELLLESVSQTKPTALTYFVGKLSGRHVLIDSRIGGVGQHFGVDD